MEINSQTEKAAQEKKLFGFWGELVKFSIVALVIVVPFRIFIAQPFIVNGASMDPTFETGQYLIVDQLSYKFETPKRGAVVIFKYPKDETKFFIKRVIGLPNETVEIRDGEVTIKNKDNTKGFKLDEPYIAYNKSDNITVTLKSDEYFVMGDNRTGSSDSRIWGPVKEKLITGRPFIRLLPLNTVSIFPGDHSEE